MSAEKQMWWCILQLIHFFLKEKEEEENSLNKFFKENPSIFQKIQI